MDLEKRRRKLWLLAVAEQADCDWRTVRKVADGGNVSTRLRRRINEAMRLVNVRQAEAVTN